MARTTIITNAYVLTCDAKNRSGLLTIVVDDGRIRVVSDKSELLVRENPHATVIDAANRLVVPGFVNAHYHGISFLLQAATRGLHYSLWQDHAPLQNTLAKLLHPSTVDDVVDTYSASGLAHLRSGTVTVGEFPPHMDEDSFRAAAAALASTGLTWCVALQNWDQIRVVQSRAVKNIYPSISLGTTDEFTVYSFEQLSKAAKELRLPLTAHIAETKSDVETVRKNFQRDPFTILSSYNLMRSHTQIIHANYATEDEVAAMKETDCTVIVSPRSTAAKQTGYPSIRHMAKHHVRLALGTDWGSTDMLEEMRFIHHLPMLLPGLRAFSPLEILRMATINGAHVLGLSSDTGSIEAGKRADLTFFSLDDIRLPVLQPNATATAWAQVLIENLATADITDVAVNGQFLYANRQHARNDAGDAHTRFKSVHAKYFAGPVTEPPAQAHPDEKAKNVLPFMPEREQQEGFESGFPPTAPAPIIGISDTPKETHPFDKLKKPARDPVKPELPKDTRRVFGDDEDF